MTFRLDEPRIKATLIAMWRKGGGDTLVKVTPFGLKPGDWPVGYCTTIKYIVGRTPAEMEQAVGFASNTKLAQGAEIFLVRPLPMAAQFELRGYSHTPEGISTSVKTPDPRYPPGLGVPQWNLVGCKQADHLVPLMSLPVGQPFRYVLARLPVPF